jgi:hypothetical protein
VTFSISHAKRTTSSDYFIVKCLPIPDGGWILDLIVRWEKEIWEDPGMTWVYCPEEQEHETNSAQLLL